MDDRATELRSVSWRDLCPWLMLFRCPTLALRMEVLFLAAAGGILTAAAWWLSGLIFYFGSPADAVPDAADSTVTVEEREEAEILARLHADLTSLPGAPHADVAHNLTTGSPEVRVRAHHRSPFAHLVAAAVSGDIGMLEPLHESWRRSTRPYLELFSLRVTLRQFGYLLFGSLTTILIWALFGGAITRSAAMQLAREERIGLGKSLKFAAGKLLSYFASPLLPLGGTALFALGVFLLVGLPMNLDVGLIWSGLVWILVLALGLVVGVLLLGLLFGWPLMWATVSTEGTDTFDALSRSYAYTMQRPFHYLFFVLVAGALGALASLLVIGFAEGVIHVSWWAADWGVFNEQRMDAIVAAASGDQATVERLANEGAEIGAAGTIGIWLFALANGVVRAVAYSFGYGYFWVAASAIYLLLRKEVDHTETDEISLDDDADSYGLPPLSEDEAGVPGVADEKPADEKPADAASASGKTSDESDESPPSDAGS